MTKDILQQAKNLEGDIITVTEGLSLVLIPEATSYLNRSVINALSKLNEKDQIEVRRLVNIKLTETLQRKEAELKNL